MYIYIYVYRIYNRLYIVNGHNCTGLVSSKGGDPGCAASCEQENQPQPAQSDEAILLGGLWVYCVPSHVTWV